MRSITLGVTAACMCAGASIAQTVQFQIVERTGQTTVVQGGDAVLDFAVRARVDGGGSLASFGFAVNMPGEPDTFGVLRRALTSNTDGTYATTFSAADPGVVGQHGLAQSYSSLALSDANFNGLINTSGGTFTNTPNNQEIGLVRGAAANVSLLQTPGVDVDHDGNPDSWSGNGFGIPPINGATASISSSVAAPYLAQGQFVDVYRFRYTVTNFACRSTFITLSNVEASVGGQFVYQTGQWVLSGTPVSAGSVVVFPYSLGDCPSPGTAGLTTGGLLVWSRRRRPHK